MTFNFIFIFPQSIGLNDITFSLDETSIVNNYLSFTGPSLYKPKDKPNFGGWKILRVDGDLSLVTANEILTKDNYFVFDASSVVSSKTDYTTRIYCDPAWTLGIGFNLYWDTFEPISAGPSYQVVTARFDVDPPTGAGAIFDIKGTYSDDAINLMPGSAFWDAFFGIYPVLLKDGVEVVKLDPNNYSKDINGNDVDITSGLAGDVMIAFPKRGLRIQQTANILEVSFTNNPNNPNYSYYAHNQDVFYVGAYQGFIDDDGKLRSLSDKAPTVKKTIGEFRTAAHLNGTNYEQFAFYQLTYLQAMYTIKYNWLNGAAALGNGHDKSGGTPYKSGLLNQQGFDFGVPGDDTQGLKFAGVEHFWGNAAQFIDGIVTDADGNYLISSSNYNDTGNGYMYKYTHDPIYNFVGKNGLCGKVAGTSQAGFAPIDDTYGTSTHYFCNDVSCHPSMSAFFGAGKGFGGFFNPGPYALNLNIASTVTGNNIGARLTYA